MTEPLSYVPAAVLPFKNRSGAAIAAGVMLLIAALFTGCGALSMPIALVLPRQPGQPEVMPAQVVIAVSFYVVLTTLLVWLGIGATLRRRWSRPLILIFTTHWLLVGIVMIVSSLAMLPVTRDTMNTVPNIQPEMIYVILGIGLFVVFIGMVVFPSIILLLMKSDEMKVTLAHFDPKPRWTDRCPIEVLGFSLTLYVTALVFALSAAYRAFPIGGVLLKGTPAIAVALVIGAVLAAAGYGVFRMKMWGWWLGLLGLLVPTLLMIPSMLMVPIAEVYQAMGTPPEHIEAIIPHETLLKTVSTAFMILLAITWVAYVARLRPAMRRPVVSDPAMPVTPA